MHLRGFVRYEKYVKINCCVVKIIYISLLGNKIATVKCVFCSVVIASVFGVL